MDWWIRAGYVLNHFAQKGLQACVGLDWPPYDRDHHHRFVFVDHLDLHIRHYVGILCDILLSVLHCARGRGSHTSRRYGPVDGAACHLSGLSQPSALRVFILVLSHTGINSIDSVLFALTASEQTTTRCETQSKMLRISSIDSESKQRFLGGFGVVNSRSL